MIYASTSCLLGLNGGFEKSLSRVLEVYASAGIFNIELGAALGRVDNLGIVHKFKKDHDANFTVHAFFPPDDNTFYLNMASGGDILKRTLAKMREAVEFARKVDAALYTFHPGFMQDLSIGDKPLSGRISREEAFQRTSLHAAEIAEYAKSYGMRVAMENMYGPDEWFLFQHAEDFERFFSIMKSKDFGMLLDVGHLELSSKAHGFSMVDFINRVKHKVFQMHLHNCIGMKDHNKFVDASVLSNFTREQLRGIALVLESNRQPINDIKESLGIIQSAI